MRKKQFGHKTVRNPAIIDNKKLYRKVRKRFSKNNFVDSDSDTFFVRSLVATSRT